MKILATEVTWSSKHECAESRAIVVERQIRTIVDDEGHKNETVFLLTLSGSFVRDGEVKTKEYQVSLSSQDMQQIKTASREIDDLINDRRYRFKVGTIFSAKINDWLSIGFVAKSRSEGSDFLDVVINENHARFEAAPGLFASFDQR